MWAQFKDSNDCRRSRDSAVGIVTKLQTGQEMKQCSISDRSKIFLCSPPRQDRLWDPPILACSGYRGSSTTVKATGREADRSLSSAAYVNVWSYIFTPLYIFRVCCIIKDHDKFNLSSCMFDIIQPQFSGFSIVVCWNYSKVLAYITVAIFRVIKRKGATELPQWEQGWTVAHDVIKWQGCAWENGLPPLRNRFSWTAKVQLTTEDKKAVHLLVSDDPPTFMFEIVCEYLERRVQSWTSSCGKHAASLAVKQRHRNKGYVVWMTECSHKSPPECWVCCVHQHHFSWNWIWHIEYTII
jgi:hypothetical protein